MILATFLSALALVSTAPDAKDKHAPPKLLNPTEIVTPSDYPIPALRAEEQGTVGVAIKIDADGRVADCTIELSSGSAALDAQTCRLVWLRAKFAPELDESGTGIASTWSQRFTWRLEESEGMPTQAWTLRLVIRPQADGSVKCGMEPGGALSSDETRSAVDQPSCDAASEEYSFMAEIKNRPGEIVVADTQFIPGRGEPKPLPKGVRLLARQVLKLAIDEKGAVSNCRKVEEEGAYIALDACKYTVPKFGPPLGKDGKPSPTEGTLVVSVYVDRESVT